MMGQKLTSETNSVRHIYEAPLGCELHPPTHSSTHPPTFIAPLLPTLAKALLGATLAGGAIGFLDWSFDDWKAPLAGVGGGVAAIAIVAVEERNARMDRRYMQRYLKKKINRIASNSSADELVGLVNLEREIEEDAKTR